MTMIRTFAVHVLILALAGPLSYSISRAGDYASREIIGFSPDGTYFAFEQYGVQDGSGFPYSDIFLIDTRKDEWMKGYPIRTLIEDESVSLSQLRTRTAREVAAVRGNFRLNEPGDHLASNPLAELSADPHRVVVNAAHRFTPPVERPVTFELAEFELASESCSQYAAGPFKGFELTLRPESGDAITMHRDSRIPESRGCPLGYAIADILSHESDGRITYAVLLHVQTLGFEGPDSRFMAVTRQLPESAR